MKDHPEHRVIERLRDEIDDLLAERLLLRERLAEREGGPGDD